MNSAAVCQERVLLTEVVLPYLDKYPTEEARRLQLKIITMLAAKPSPDGNEET